MTTKTKIANERTVNAALRAAGVPVIVTSRNGYKSIQTIDANGPEVASIYCSYWHNMTIAEWVEECVSNYADATK